MRTVRLVVANEFKNMLDELKREKRVSYPVLTRQITVIVKRIR